MFLLLAFALSKPQVIRDVSPEPSLPKKKEPPHCGDSGWGRFLFRQFDLLLLSLSCVYKLCDNTRYGSESSIISMISKSSFVFTTSIFTSTCSNRPIG
jgi:hypothetical protein